MTKTLISAGCSLTLDHYQSTWADYLSQKSKMPLKNIGARGAGLDFISKRLMTELHGVDPSTVLVAVMLPSMDRFDYYVDSSHVMKQDLLQISSWQDGRRPSFVRLDGELSDLNGYCLTGSWGRGIKKYWYKYYYNKTAVCIDYWFNVIHMQNFLKLHGFDYFFTSGYDLDDLIELPARNDASAVEYTDMKKMIDFDQFICHRSHKGLMSFATDRGYEILKCHPVPAAHENYVDTVIFPWLVKKYGI